MEQAPELARLLGPDYALIIGVLLIAAYVALKVIPIMGDHSQQRIDIERDRERRKAEESARRDDMDRERAVLEGRWLDAMERATQVQEQTNSVMAGLTATNDRLIQSLDDSKDRSRDMARQVDDIHHAVVVRREGTD